VPRERLVALEGTLNFRDIGGYPTVDGRHVSWGRVYRSDALHKLTEADQAQLVRLGIRHVWDFRHDREVENDVSRLPSGVEHHRVPIGPNPEQARAMPQGPAARPEGPGAGIQGLTGGQTDISFEDVAGMYAGMLEHFAPQFAAVVRAASDEADLPILFHCTAGKDRTGVAAALLLAALGVPDEHVIADYELTNEYRTPTRLKELAPELEEQGIDIERVLPLFSAQGPVMQLTLDALRDQHGSIDAYLEEAGGVEAATLDRLRALLLDP